MHRAPALALIAALFAVQIAVRFHAGLTTDVAWYVYVAEGLLSGKKLYVDFLEVNPPLGMWLVAAPVWVGKALGVGPVHALYAFTFALIAASLLVSARYAGHLDERQKSLFSIVASVALLMVPGANFGQREHFMMILFLPWIMLRLTLREVGGFERAAVGIAAALGIALKPYALFAPLFAEVALLTTSKNWRSLLSLENLSATATLIAYLVLTALVAPAFINVVLPLAVAAYVPYFGLDFKEMLANAHWALLFLGFGLLNIKQERPRAFLAAGLGFLLSFFLQRKGFDYQILPATMLGLLAASALFDFAEPATVWRKRATAAFATVAGFSLITAEQAAPKGRNFIGAALATSGVSAKSVFAASSEIDLAFPYVLDSDLTWASRQPHQWLMPYVAAHWKSGEATADPVVREALSLAVDDLAELKPDVVLVGRDDRLTKWHGGAFNYIDFWRSEPRFSAIWANYERRGTADGFDVYILKNKSPAQGGAS